jgi:hypothetical protein
MTTTLNGSGMAPEGNRSADGFQARRDVETVGKTVAIACLQGAIESFLAGRNLSRAQLAEDVCGMSEGNFSKVSNGVQGDFWELVYKLPGDIRADFFQRLHESERIDPILAATTHLITAACRFLQVAGVSKPMAKAHVPERKQRRA